MTLGASVDGLRVVSEGLAANDVIVVNGLQHVRPGITVKPTKAAMDGDRTGVAQLAAPQRDAKTVLASRVSPACAFAALRRSVAIEHDMFAPTHTRRPGESRDPAALRTEKQLDSGLRRNDE